MELTDEIRLYVERQVNDRVNEALSAWVANGNFGNAAYRWTIDQVASMSYNPGDWCELGRAAAGMVRRAVHDPQIIQDVMEGIKAEERRVMEVARAGRDDEQVEANGQVVSGLNVQPFRLTWENESNIEPPASVLSIIEAAEGMANAWIRLETERAQAVSETMRDVETAAQPY